MAKSKEAEPTEKEESLLTVLLYDTLLYSNPMVASNVRQALADLLRAIGRPKLAEKAMTV